MLQAHRVHPGSYTLFAKLLIYKDSYFPNRLTAPHTLRGCE